MEIQLKRFRLTDKSTIGKLYVNGAFECYSLEDAVRPVKIKGQTAIAYGKYEVIVNLSTRFKVKMPLLLNVPEFSGVRIHPGNSAADTEGCILTGETYSENGIIYNSRKAYEKLFDKIKVAFEAKEKIFIEIIKE